MILNPDAMRFTCQPFTDLQSGGPKDTTMWIRLACTCVHTIHSSLYLLWVGRTHLWKRFPGLCAPVGKKSTKGNYWEHLPFRFESTDSDMSWNTRIVWQLVDLSPFARFRVFHLDQQQLTHQMKHSYHRLGSWPTSALDNMSMYQMSPEAQEKCLDVNLQKCCQAIFLVIPAKSFTCENFIQNQNPSIIYISI